MEEMKRDLVAFCIRWMFTCCMEDNAMIAKVEEVTGITEGELFETFASLDEDLGLDLEPDAATE